MGTLESSVQTGSAEFSENRAAMAALIADIDAKTEQVSGGGGMEARSRHTKRGQTPATRPDRGASRSRVTVS